MPTALASAEQISIRLPQCSWDAAAAIGRKREELRRERGNYRNEKWRDFKHDTWTRNSLGAVAEFALAMHYGKSILQDWCENKSFSLEHEKITADVGHAIQVRSTAWANGGLVMFDHDDKADAAWVLASVDAGNRIVTFVGWCELAEGRRPDYWRSDWRAPCYCVPGQALRPMNTIPPEAVYGPLHA